MRAAPNRRPITYGEVPLSASGAGPGAGCTLDVSTVAGTPLVIDTHHGRAVLLWDAGRPRRRMRRAMFRYLQSFRVVAALSAIILAAVMGTARTANAATAARPAASYQVGPITDVSTCSRQNAEGAPA